MHLTVAFALIGLMAGAPITGAGLPLAQPLVGSASTDTATDPAATSAWSVSGPSRLVTLWSPRTELAITAGDHPLSNLRIVTSTLKNVETGAEIRTPMLRLCGAASSGRGSPPQIPAGQAAPVELRLDTSALTAGVYTGGITLAAEGGTGTKTLELRVEHTSAGRWAWGGLAILAGIVLSWLATTFLRRLSIRTAALASAAAIADRAQRLLDEVKAAETKTGQPMSRLTGRLTDVRSALSLETLKELGYIPSSVPNPVVVATDPNPAYAQYLTEQRGRLDALAALVRDGLPEPLAAWPDAGHRAAAAAALTSLDGAADTAQTVAAAQAAVIAILAAFHAALGGPHAAPPGTPPAGAATMPSARELEIRLQHVSLSAWGIWLLLTLVAGLSVLIFTNYGFGVPLDYCKCLLWGVGVPAAGQSLQQTTASTISTSLKFP